MKRIILIFTVLLCSLTAIQAQVPVLQPVMRLGLIYRVADHYIDPTGGMGGGQRNPEAPLYIGLQGHTIYFDTMPHPAFTVTLLDIATGEMIYETVVGENDATLVLPSSFTGDYEIRLAPSDAYYYGGEITL